VNRSIKNIFLLFWATAVLAICVGSLINFHQHKIWGKPILGEILYIKRDKEKTVDLLKFVNTDLSNGNGTDVVSDVPVIQDSPFHLVAIDGDVNYQAPDLPDYSYYLLFSGSLRAPPVA
jgi:hypothetical protein